MAKVKPTPEAKQAEGEQSNQNTPPESGALASSPGPVQPEPAAPTPEAKQAEGKDYGADKITLEKYDDKGNVIDRLVLPMAAYNNLSANHKNQWKVKKPDSIK